MCGIVGILAQQQIQKTEISGMLQAVSHRGPDAQEIFVSENETAALGHARLSIIDLSSEASQPMTSADQRYSIIFNGEIYNFQSLRKEIEKSDPSFRFRTQSDTEVLLEGFVRWGAAICSRLEGMFAFAILDKQKNEMFLCRDRIGKKPLFYFHHNGHFIFASEIKALLKHPVVQENKSINKLALSIFLHLGYIPEPYTAFNSIRKFPAGHYAYVDANLKSEFKQYWSLRDFTKPSLKSDNTVNVKSKLTDLLYQAVEKRLISDVPLGAFLSGGTDSSLVVAIASKLKKDPLKTFTIGFREQTFDQSDYARKVAKKLNTDHHEFILREEDSVALLEDYLKHFDEPFADTSAIPTMLVSKLAKKAVSVALTGDGGDELFLGYGAYDWANRLATAWSNFIPETVIRSLRKFGSEKLKRGSYLFSKPDPELLRSHIFSQTQVLFSNEELARKLLLNSNGNNFFSYIDLPEKLSPSEQQAIFDLQYYLKDDLLVKVDRASMFYALECRCPLLDHHVIEFALSLDFRYKKKGLERKWILKEILRDYLPDELIYRPKWGFSIPLSRWMKHELSYLMDQYLSEDVIRNAGMVDYDFVKKLKTSFLSGEEFLYNRLWVLIVLHKWLCENT
jgi:asparagine synthase (glutamine-hydrolysing)